LLSSASTFCQSATKPKTARVNRYARMISGTRAPRRLQHLVDERRPDAIDHAVDDVVGDDLALQPVARHQPPNWSCSAGGK
jgi:hypothetical protein